MNILFYDMGSYTYKDIQFHLEKSGHNCKFMLYRFPNNYEDAFFCDRFRQELTSSAYDIVFSVNFFPLVAKLCAEIGIPYLCWVYDSPMEELALSYLRFDTNYVCLFDRAEVQRYHAMGFKRVFHLPLAVNSARIDATLNAAPYPQKYLTDVSFIGQLYNSTLDTLLVYANDYIKGYVEGIVQAQLRIYGYDFIDELIPDDVLDYLNEVYQQKNMTGVHLTRIGLIYTIQKHITNFERTFLLEELGNHFTVNYHTQKPYDFRSNVTCMPPVDYYNTMPYIFRTSKLNLCPTLRSIQSGIPLRALDIMVSKGTLFSNYQIELAENFTDGEEVVMYSGMEEAIEKASFYISHGNIREKIARAGYEKTKRMYDYSVMLPKLFDILKSN